MEQLLLGMVVSVALNLVMWLPTFFLKTDKFTDISYALTFVVVAGYGFISGSQGVAQTLILIMLCVWAARLGGFLLFRVWKNKKDRRFDGMRENALKFLRFWLLQGISVGIITISYVLFMNKSNVRIGILELLGLGVWMLGFALETIADIQKYRFHSDPNNKGKWIEEGVWAWSRHPNYLGEMMVWIGVFLFTVASLVGAEKLVGLISPLYICGILLFVSGVPILEKLADTRWGDNKKYLEYKKKVGVVLPNGWTWAAFWILITQVVGGLGAIFTASNIPVWYAGLNKPSWNPPNWLFGPVWTSLYLLMAVAMFLVWRKNRSITVLVAYGSQLFLNFLWSVLFFGQKMIGVALFEIVFLWIAIVINIAVFRKYSKFAAWLLVPYLAWVSFASFLNFTVWRLNL